MPALRSSRPRLVLSYGDCILDCQTFDRLSWTEPQWPSLRIGVTRSLALCSMVLVMTDV